ncbi:hypothetical protein LY78DRAFT_479414 [Colletotrichum sublineola]|nr:hypothetical protein LY78DRAFT_479414 [Colletotrichum sublineola]
MRHITSRARCGLSIDRLIPLSHGYSGPRDPACIGVARDRAGIEVGSSSRDHRLPPARAERSTWGDTGGLKQPRDLSQNGTDKNRAATRSCAPRLEGRGEDSRSRKCRRSSFLQRREAHGQHTRTLRHREGHGSQPVPARRQRPIHIHAEYIIYTHTHIYIYIQSTCVHIAIDSG